MPRSLDTVRGGHLDHGRVMSSQLPLCLLPADIAGIRETALSEISLESTTPPRGMVSPISILQIARAEKNHS
jgi:hypothetical protein